MPDTKITRARIRDHLRRLWLFYLVGAVLVLFANHLVFTVTRPSYSDAETLKVLLLNVNPDFSGDELLERTRHLGFQAVELAPVAAVPGDVTGEMLLKMQLTGGFGDLCICDDNGLQLLQQRDAAGEAQTLGEDMHILVLKNGTDPQSAESALPILAEMITE